MICYCWVFYHRFKFQDSLCNGCHNLTFLCVNISDIAITTVKNVDYRCIIHNISKTVAINWLKNSVLEDCGYINIFRMLAFHNKFEKRKALKKELNEELMPVACSVASKKMVKFFQVRR